MGGGGRGWGTRWCISMGIEMMGLGDFGFQFQRGLRL